MTIISYDVHIVILIIMSFATFHIAEQQMENLRGKELTEAKWKMRDEDRKREREVDDIKLL